MVLSVILIFAVLAVTLYYYFTRTFNYWKDRHVPGPKPVPFFGSVLKSATRQSTFGEDIWKIYNDFANEKVVGIFRMTTPTMLVRDLDIVKDVLIKDFQNFVDRGMEMSKKGLGSNLFSADGDTWRVLRNRFTPIFTSQKLKNMMYLLVDRADKFTDYVKEITAKSPEHEIHDLVQKYTMSAITACAFGLDIDTFRGEIEELKKIDKAVFTPSFVRELQMLYPGLLKSLNMELIPRFVTKFFKELVNTVITQRNGMPSDRKDFMDLILELRNEKVVKGMKKFDDDKDRILEITDGVIEAQALVFYVAGYETSASTMGFMLYQLALDVDIQDKLRAEVDEYLKRNNNQITLDNMKELTYMQQVFDETLRMYPIVDVLQRSAQNDYQVAGTDVTVPKGRMVLISVHGIHHDEKIYPNPEKFDPERFTPEKVAARHSCAYLPFGLGPRHCIGMRFAQVQAKMCMIALLSKFKVEAGKNTVRSFRFNPYRVVLGPIGGFHLNIYPRTDLAR